jgi:hypothetical protein
MIYASRLVLESLGSRYINTLYLSRYVLEVLGTRTVSIIHVSRLGLEILNCGPMDYILAVVDGDIYWVPHI